MPSQRKLCYFDTASNDVSNDSWSALPSGGTGAGHYNLVRDLSMLNRYGLEHTNRKGTPLVYRVRVTLHGMTYAGLGPGTAGFRGVQTDSDDTSTVTSADGFTVMKFEGVQNNWVIKNAAEDFHKARETMYSDAGVKKSDRGKYAHTLRYNYDGASDTWGTPVDGAGAAFTGGTWDVSTLSYGSDGSFQLGLVGNGDDEETNAFSGTYLSIGHAYLMSRINMAADTNPQADETPAKFSTLKKMLAGAGLVQYEKSSDVIDEARGEQDNPPYEVLDVSNSGDVTHDITKPVELGRVAVELGAISRSIVIDVPFGIMDVNVQHYSKDDDNETFTPFWGVELLDIKEMTG
jgi:hypothetical protein